jgi:4-amino-4-deoxy-L-arabinose transferase-like glycosyltransferase
VALLAVLAAAPLLLLGLGGAPFDDPGEGMHAEIARELAASADPLRLTLDGVRYVDKPPLLYALVAGAFSIAGPGEASARAVSALSALLAIGSTAWLGARLGGARLGLLAGLALLSSWGFFAYGRYVRPDAAFVASIAIGFAAAIVGIAEVRPALVISGFAAFGVAALAKDPLGALGPPVVIAAALALRGALRPVGAWLPGRALLALLVLGLGWYAAAAVVTPGFAWYTVVDNHVLNLVRARGFPDEDVPLGAAAFLLVAVLAAVPWTLSAGATVWRLARTRAWRHAVETPWMILALWAIAVIGLATLSPFRLPHYGLPAYPAVALLAARAWRDLGWRRLAWAHAAVLGALAIACAIAWLADGALLTSVLDVTDVATRKRAAGTAAPLPPLSAFVPLLGATALTLGAAAVALVVLAAAPGHADRGRWRAAFVVTAALVATLPSVAAALSLVSAHRAVSGIAQDLAARVTPGDIVAHEGPIENSGALEWYGGVRPVIVDGRRSVLGFGATLPGAEDRFWDAARLAVEWRGRRRVWLLTARPEEASVAAALPGARLVAASGGRRLYVNR